MNWKPPETDVAAWSPPSEDVPITPTGLPSINAPTEPSKMQKALDLVKSGVKATPGLGPMMDIASRPLLRRIGIENAAQQGGAELGTAAGAALAPIAGPIAPVAGNVIGAGVGNAVGGIISDVADDPQAAQEALKIFTDPTNQEILKQLSTLNPDMVMQKARSMLGDAGRRFTAGALSQVLGLGVGKVLGMFDLGSKAVPGLTDSVGSLPEKFGVNLNPAQETNSKVADIIDRIARHGANSAETMRVADEATRAGLKDSQHIITTDLAGGLHENIPRSELKDFLTATHNLGEAVQDNVSNSMYGRVDDLAGGKVVKAFSSNPADPSGAGTPTEYRVGGIQVPLTKLKDFVTGKMQQSLEINKFDQELVDKTGAFFKNLTNQDDQITFLAAKNLRSQLLDLARESSNKSLQALAGQAGSILDKSMQSAAENLSPEAYTAWRQANGFFKAGKEVFNNELMSKFFLLDKKLPEDVGSAIYRNGNVTQIQQVKSALKRASDLISNPAYSKELQSALEARPELSTVNKVNYTDSLNAVRRGYLQELFGNYRNINVNSSTPESLNFHGIYAELTHPETRETLQELFKPEQIKALEGFAKVGALSMKKAPEIVSKSVSAMLSTVGMPLHTAAAWLMTSPTGQRMLMEGLGAKTLQAALNGTLGAARTILTEKAREGGDTLGSENQE